MTALIIGLVLLFVAVCALMLAGLCQLAGDDDDEPTYP